MFIMRYKSTLSPLGYELDAGDVLFKSPQKVMESGIFLPLDDYIDNNTKHTEWEKFPKVIMDAGRNAEGQQIIPISYTFPVIAYPKEIFDYTPDRLLSWTDMLTDPELAPFSVDLVNCNDYIEYPQGDPFYRYKEYFEFVIGQNVDYKEGKLLFTEEELLQRIKDVLALNSEDVYPEAEEGLLGIQHRSYSQPVTLLPLYSDDGGITARIDFYAAVNRNTDSPEEAFAVIDRLLSTEAQQNFKLYSEYLCPYMFEDFPMVDDLYKKGTPIRLHANEENYTEFSELHEQITHAHFMGETSVILNELLIQCASMPDITEQLVHEAYMNLQRRVRE